MIDTAQFTAFYQADIDLVLGCTAKAFDGVEQLTALNMQLIKTSLSEGGETVLSALSAKDPQSLLSLEARVLQPAAEKATAYTRQVYEIVASTRAEIEKLAAERMVGVQKTFLAAVDAATKDAPEGMSGSIALFKSTVVAANNAFDGLQKASHEAAEAAEANYTAVTGSMARAAGSAKRA